MTAATPSLALTKAEPVESSVVLRVMQDNAVAVCVNCERPLLLIPFFEIWTHQETGNRRCPR